MCRHAGFRWGGQGGGNSLAAREGSAAVWSERAVLFCGFVLYIPLFCIIVVPVPFGSVKLPLSRPTSFCLFLSILLRTPVGGARPRGAFVAGCSRNQNRLRFLNWYYRRLWQVLGNQVALCLSASDDSMLLQEVCILLDSCRPSHNALLFCRIIGKILVPVVR